MKRFEPTHVHRRGPQRRAQPLSAAGITARIRSCNNGQDPDDGHTWSARLRRLHSLAAAVFAIGTNTEMLALAGAAP